MLERLQIFLVVVVVWVVGAFVMPQVFGALAAAILVWALLHMALERKVHGAGVFFATVAVLTGLVAVVGWRLQGESAGLRGEALQAKAGEEAGAAAPDESAKPDGGDEADGQDGATPSESERRAALADGLVRAKKLVADRAQCGSLSALAEVWGVLRTAKAEDEEYGRVQAAVIKLEGCRQRAQKAQQKGLRAERMKQRQTLAKALGRELQTQGLGPVKVSAAGKDKSGLVLQAKKASPQDLEKLMGQDDADETSVRGRVQAAGFGSVTLKGKGKGKPLVIPLSPKTDEVLAAEKASQLGLAEPFELEQGAAN